jgi:hypothetical protein
MQAQHPKPVHLSGKAPELSADARGRMAWQITFVSRRDGNCTRECTPTTTTAAAASSPFQSSALCSTSSSLPKFQR